MYFRKILVIGSTNTDMVIKTSKLPAPGETILGGDFFMNPGGKGANQAVAAARLGGKVAFVCKTGNDIFGKQARQLFKDEGIDTSFVFTDNELPSGVALITVDEGAENCIVVAPGANAALGRDDIENASEAIRNAAIVLMQLETPLTTVEYAALLAHEAGVRVILNPAPAQVLPDSLLSRLFAITPNETEATLLTGIRVTDEQTALQAAKVLKNKGVQIVIVTLGAAGAFVLSDSISARIPAPRVIATDTTAAGDTFNGALAVGMAEGMDLQKAVEFANKAASITVTRMGAQSAIPYWNEIV